MRQIIAALVLGLLLASCASDSTGDIKSDPEQSFAHFYNLGIAAFEQRNYAEAVRNFQRSIELNPGIARTHKELGTTYLFMNNNQAAADCFERALSLDPRLIDAHNGLGVAYMNLGKFRQAEQHFNAILNEPDYGTPFIPYFNLGNLYFQQQDYRQALLYYMEALKEEAKITPDYRLAIHRQLGYVHYQLGDYRQAYTAFEKVLVLNPRDLEASYQGGMSAMKMGNSDDARLMFQKVLTIDPNSALAQEARKRLDELDN